EVDEAGFKKLMNEQRDRAKADAKAKKSGHTDLTEYRAIVDKYGTTKFLGYENISTEAKLTGVLVNGKVASEVNAGSELEIMLDRTPFYAEGGGQLADNGVIKLANGAVVKIEDVQTPVPGLFVHRGTVVSGVVKSGEAVVAEIDLQRRLAISRAHTATHMVHKAFREALGETATQAGSENAPGRFRFDFPSTSAVPTSVLNDVESRVNELLIADLQVSAQVMTQDAARAMGATALFGEKYGDQVRVVSVGDWAKELCGGTHVSRSGQLGLVKLLSESSIGAGVRRVEALVGHDAYKFLAREHVLLNSLTEIIKGVRAEELPQRISELVEKMKSMEKEMSAVNSAKAMAAAGELVKKNKSIGSASLIIEQLGNQISGEDMRAIALDLKSKVKTAIVVLATVNDAKPLLVAAVSADAIKLGIKAGELIKVGSAILGGGGGGKDDFAQGGGLDAGAITKAFTEITKFITEKIN
ncbi:MAG: alanine--tRNA ligase, partial [Candidatus Nanopelagicus sp.]|nr:alanine--tRNA ligase [Candidatus Nanopelagicus sp.]